MTTPTFGRRRETHFEPPIEMRFVDLFMIIVTALMFVTVMLSVISAFVGSARVDVAPHVATVSLPEALLGRSYQLTLAGSGGSGAYTWKLSNGSLPAGLILDSTNGVISGTPTRLERTQFTVQLTDQEKRSDSRDMLLEVRSVGQQAEQKVASIYVSAAAVILPDAVSNEPYSFRFKAEGGFPPYRWSVAGGKLPPGLDLTSSGEVVGSPIASDNASWEFQVTAVDSTNAQVTQNARLLVKASPTPIWRTILFGAVTTLGWILAVIGMIVVIGFVLVDLFAEWGEGLVQQKKKTARWRRWFGQKK